MACLANQEETLQEDGKLLPAREITVWVSVSVHVMRICPGGYARLCSCCLDCYSDMHAAFCGTSTAVP